MKYNLENRRRSALTRREADVIRWTAFLNKEKNKKSDKNNWGNGVGQRDDRVEEYYTSKLKTAEFEVARLKEKIGA